ncbi:hypothetical protein CB0940_05749 [Cercospora beticola]|uniref:Uncharacterized protein n=1 Tax=Cercospora beticola TaxID=122368 RepID=A0A2G5I0D7_CERBT|nr:hypothetical protein CB0940_05749 [Cercospora beticola]PIA97983.1 hypothetical protein CB0940_05749 [Cercospora beticola]WPA98330.1 hypothetical protein RHO25_002942 [Cercospora beticola]
MENRAARRPHSSCSAYQLVRSGMRAHGHWYSVTTDPWGARRTKLGSRAKNVGNAGKSAVVAIRVGYASNSRQIASTETFHYNRETIR